MGMLSPAVEDYLKTIYKLHAEDAHAGEAVSTSAIATAMDVSSASVTNMAKRLADMKLAEYESYKGVRLTEAGEKIALEIIRHHRLLELYLKEVMGYSWEKLHEEAEHLEHHISEEFEDKLEELLGYPTHDPHGHPIPTRDGTMADIAVEPLSDVAEGETVWVHHLSDADPRLLHHLEGLNLMPGAEVKVVEKAPFDGPLRVRVRGAGEPAEEVIGQVVARSVFVQATEPSEAER